MKISKRAGMLALAAGCTLAAGGAAGRNEPNPPPSGIVVHLFGPGSLTAGMGAAPGAAAQPGGPVVTYVPVPARNKPLGGAANEQPAPPSAGSVPPVSVTASGGTDEAPPTLGPILHQMFVTGDPNAKPGSGLTAGRNHNLAQ